MKRIFCIIMTAILMVGALAGCGGNGGGDQGKTQAAMGRYIEQQLAEISQAEAYNLHLDADGNLVFFNRDVDGEMTRYLLNVDTRELKQEALTWYQPLLGENDLPWLATESEDGIIYLLYRKDVQGNETKYGLLRCADGETVEEVPVSDWVDGKPTLSGKSVGNSSVNYSFALEGTDVTFGDETEYIAMSAIIALPDGEFLLGYADKGARRYAADGTFLREYPGDAYRAYFAVFGNQVILGNAQDSKLLSYELDTGKPGQTYSYENFSYDTLAIMDETGLSLADSTGIYRQAQGGTIWEKLVDGDLTSMVMPNLSLDAMTPDGTGGYYVILSSEGRAQIVQYVYSADTPTNPDTELTIFSMNDSNTVRQTIGEFQRRNPNVRVNFQVAMGDDSTATAEDIIRGLNTQILNGKGPDLFLLDGLPVESYIEKGVLADLSDLATQKAGLMTNLLGAYERDGKLYGIPARFTVPVMVGKPGDMDGLRSLADLVAKLEETAGDETPFLYPDNSLWSDEGMIATYFDACMSDWYGDATLNEAGLTAYLRAALALDTAVKGYMPEVGGGMSMATLVVSGGSSRGFEAINMGSDYLKSGKYQFYTQELIGHFGLHMIGRNLGETEYRMESLFGGNYYLPKVSVGLAANGKQQELARAFVELMLSPAVQDNYLYDGFSINRDSLQKLVEKERGDYSSMDFLTLCDELDTPVLTDEVIKDVVLALCEDIIAGELTPEQAAAKAVEQTQLYLSE